MSEDFGRLLRQYRNENKLTQPQLIKKLCEQEYPQFDKSTISRWENGQRIPNRDIVETLEDVLNIRRGLLLRAARYPVDVEYARDEDVILAHRSDMVGMAQEMLSDNLEYVSVRHIKEQFKDHLLDAKIFSIKGIDGYFEGDLTTRLQHNFVKLFRGHSADLVEYFCEHINTGYPEIVKAKLRDAIGQNPYELIGVLNLIIASRKIRGTCPVCEDYHTKNGGV